MELTTFFTAELDREVERSRRALQNVPPANWYVAVTHRQPRQAILSLLFSLERTQPGAERVSETADARLGSLQLLETFGRQHLNVLATAG